MTTVRRLGLLVACLSLPFPGATLRAQQPSAPPADTTLRAVETFVRSLYGLVSFGPNERTDWAPVRALFAPEAVVVLRTSRAAHSVFTVDGFINDFIRFDSIPAVARSGFQESVVRLRSTVVGDIAHVLVLYEAQVRNSPRPPQQGIDSFELLRRDGRWRIVSLTNEVVTPDAPVPAELRP
jgi:hypothetical protein